MLYGVKFTKDELRAFGQEALINGIVRVIPAGVTAKTKQGQALARPFDASVEATEAV